MLIINKDLLRIQNYKTILTSTEKEISIILDKKIKIAGNNLKIIFFEKEEIIVKGNILNITFYEK